MSRHWPVLDLNPGRPPTRIGGDGIDPWVSLERRHACVLVDELRRRGVAHRVRPMGGYETDGSCVLMDRISFPGGDVHALRRLLRSWMPPMG